LYFSPAQALRIRKGVAMDGITGQIINLMSNDVAKFDNATSFFHDLWKGPVEAILLSYFIFREIGVAGLVGMAFLLSFIPLQCELGVILPRSFSNDK
jgi:ATP-binding cassette, subfamily C (CFTR/MRP), member 4